jgi:hypothetical protein
MVLNHLGELNSTIHRVPSWICLALHNLHFIREMMTLARSLHERDTQMELDLASRLLPPPLPVSVLSSPNNALQNLIAKVFK